MNYRRSVRQQSIHSRKYDEQFVVNFLATKGVTPDDVENAFKLLSKDGLKVTKSDIKDFADKYFKGRLKMVFNIVLII